MQAPIPKKIAFLRALGLGDFICTLPVLEALRHAFPQAEIVYLGKQWTKDFHSGRKMPIDRVEVVPPYPGVGENENFSPEKKSVNIFFGKMKQEKFDLAIQGHGGGKNSNPFMKKLGARLTIGAQAVDAIGLDLTIPYLGYQHDILRNLEIISLLGVKCQNLQPKIEVMPRDLENFQSVHKIVKKHKTVVIHPGASDPKRRWPIKNFIAVAKYFIKISAQVFVTGTSSEEKLVQQIAKTIAKGTVNLCSKLSLSALVGLMAEASVLISNDTGPLHLARAVGTKTVGIFLPINIPRFGPLFVQNSRVLNLGQTKVNDVINSALEFF